MRIPDLNAVQPLHKSFLSVTKEPSLHRIEVALDFLQDDWCVLKQSNALLQLLHKSCVIDKRTSIPHPALSQVVNAYSTQNIIVQN